MESSIFCGADGSKDPELALAVRNLARLRRRGS
jgi:hypothetical protein